MLTLSMIILHLMKISSNDGSFSNNYKNTMFTVIGFLWKTGRWPPALLLTMGDTARSARVVLSVQGLVDRLTQFYLGLGTTINIHIWELRWELNDDVLSIPKQAW